MNRKKTYKELNPEKALIFRITHINNMAWIFKNGLHCRNSRTQDPDFTRIGLPDLIERRRTRALPDRPGETLADYIPFYCTPFSIMGYKIRTGHEPAKVPNKDIVILVASLHKLADSGTFFIFSDSHAVLKTAQFFTALKDLDKIDWDILQRKDFRRDEDDPGKKERYQAEALVHRHLPVDRLKGIVCQGAAQKERLEQERGAANLNSPVKAAQGWYFP